MFVASLRHCLARLFVFSGRDRPGQFWPYAGVVLGITTLFYAIGFVAMFVTVFARVRQFAVDHPDQVTVDQGPGHYSVQVHGWHPELMPDFTVISGLTLALALLVTLTLGAAVTRRLHDSDVRGWIALIPLALLTSGMAMMARLFAALPLGREPDFGLFVLIFANNLAYLASLGLLIYFLVRKGTPGPNRFGEPADQT